MKKITITPDLLQQYALMTKNEILLHMAIKSLADDGRIKRNLNQIGKLLSKRKQRLLDAEYGLKQRGLLRIYWISGRRWWYLYDQPVGESPSESNDLAPLPAATPAVTDEKPKKRRGILRKIRDALVGTPLDNFDLDR